MIEEFLKSSSRYCVIFVKGLSLIDCKSSSFLDPLMVDLLLLIVLRGILLLSTRRRFSQTTVRISTEANMKRILKHHLVMDV